PAAERRLPHVGPGRRHWSASVSRAATPPPTGFAHTRSPPPSNLSAGAAPPAARRPLSPPTTTGEVDRSVRRAYPPRGILQRAPSGQVQTQEGPGLSAPLRPLCANAERRQATLSSCCSGS